MPPPLGLMRTNWKDSVIPQSLTNCSTPPLGLMRTNWKRFLQVLIPACNSYISPPLGLMRTKWKPLIGVYSPLCQGLPPAFAWRRINGNYLHCYKGGSKISPLPPPSPEGELMETLKRNRQNQLPSFPPPSPEGELMETKLLVRLVGLNKTAKK